MDIQQVDIVLLRDKDIKNVDTDLLQDMEIQQVGIVLLQDMDIQQVDVVFFFYKIYQTQCDKSSELYNPDN